MAETSVVVGGTAGIGAEVGRALALRGGEVIITGRDPEKTRHIAATLGKNVKGIGFDISKPHAIAHALAGVGTVRNLVIGAIERDTNTVKDYNIDRAINLVTMKLVGYTAVVHALHARMVPNASIVLFGGLAKERPYPGSTTVTAVNGAVTSMVRTLATELAPMRVNAIHPGIIGDSPYWAGKSEALARTIARTPIGRLATMQEVVNATLFLLDNQAINGVNLNVDGGWVLL
ncbi:MAG TPA: SDR family oxidoreductase [Pseudolabrys sp.]|nr:SDR family oxidoreductase [Pseudolabrys sp.]HVY19774.1 SDR family oxidoreductase [Bauldia sp.]